MRAALLTATVLGWGALVAWSPSRVAAAPVDLDPDVEIARRHFERGTELYGRGDYQDAITEFEAAERAKPRPELRYNIARCHDRLEQLPEAIAAYKAFLATATTAPVVVDVAERIRVLEQRAQAARERSARRRPPGWYVAPTIVGALALALAATGAGLLGSVRPEYDVLVAGPCASSCDPSLYSELERRTYAGYGVLGVAGVVAVVDVGLWAALARGKRVSPAR